jgi:hypothetical protein
MDCGVHAQVEQGKGLTLSGNGWLQTADGTKLGSRTRIYDIISSPVLLVVNKCPCYCYCHGFLCTLARPTVAEAGLESKPA